MNPNRDYRTDPLTKNDIIDIAKEVFNSLVIQHKPAEKQPVDELNFRQRLVVERANLNQKIPKLEAFIGTDTYNTLTKKDMLLLDLQLYYMVRYSDILSERIINAEQANAEDFTDSDHFTGIASNTRPKESLLPLPTRKSPPNEDAYYP